MERSVKLQKVVLQRLAVLVFSFSILSTLAPFR